MTESSQPQAKYLKDYQAPEFLIPTIHLYFNLDDHNTLVRSNMSVVRQNRESTAIVLNSQVKEVCEVKIDGQAISPEQYQIANELLTIAVDKDEFCLEIESVVDPKNNTELEGLYKSSGVFCTQCEAEGFRKITPFIDRPDVLSVYTVTIFADKSEYPYLLSNGNDVERGESEEDGSAIHWVKWHDPHPKPCYLFALVAGDFDLLQDKYTTSSGKDVELQLFVDKGNKHLGVHAMTSLIKSMAWDEQTYGLEYDLDKYMIVAVDFFNMGAMENKGLNVFNSKYVLADENTATDADFHGVEAVIAHEYFHNWTGNRVTCRDWFQLSLKEGLTVFRDQQFSADMGTEVIERIKHASIMRSHQFAEDAGPMSHPIRPEKVIEMNNFYTVTVYDKGAEVIRMMHSLLGKDGFRKGMDLYFNRHDGQAVTCDDFVSAMADANNYNLELFKNWYSQAGTPVVAVEKQYEANTLTVKVSQSIPTHQKSGSVKPLLIPIKYELLDKTSGESLQRGTWVLEQTEQTFLLGVAVEPELVLFENFCAPVKVDYDLSLDSRLFIVKNASDPFCRWDQMQQVWLQLIKQSSPDVSLISNLVADIITDKSLSDDIAAELLAIPSFESIAQFYDIIDATQIIEHQQIIIEHIAKANHQLLRARLNELTSIENGYEISKVAQRRLKQVVLSYLAHIEENETLSLINESFTRATNMTEKAMCLQAAKVADIELTEKIALQLTQEFNDNVLVFDKALNAIGQVSDDSVYELMAKWSLKDKFDRANPNRMRALYGAFVAGNPKQFHHQSGKGYEFLTDLLIELDNINPQIAARMVSPLLAFKRFAAPRNELMRNCLQRLSNQKLSNDLFEKVSSALS